MASIDLNADLGEGDRYDDELLTIVSSCNIACGGHAGDASSMAVTVKSALANGVSIGAHPSYPDREGFGRRSNFAAGDELQMALRQQIDALQAIAARNAASLTHVKPHGALYNDAARDRKLADLVAMAVAAISSDLAIVGAPDSELQNAALARDQRFVAEAFVDRAYRGDGSLVPRSEAGAVHSDINTITTQALRLAADGEVTAQNGAVIDVTADTLCIHGDTEGAADIARAVRDVLLASGIEIRAKQ